MRQGATKLLATLPRVHLILAWCNLADSAERGSTLLLCRCSSSSSCAASLRGEIRNMAPVQCRACRVCRFDTVMPTNAVRHALRARSRQVQGRIQPAQRASLGDQESSTDSDGRLEAGWGGGGCRGRSTGERGGKYLYSRGWSGEWGGGRGGDTWDYSSELTIVCGRCWSPPQAAHSGGVGDRYHS